MGEFYLTDDDRRALNKLLRSFKSGSLIPPMRRQPPRESRRKVFFRNDASETIPPYSVIHEEALEDLGGRQIIVAKKPMTTPLGPYHVTSGREVEYPNKYGMLQIDWYLLVRFDTGTPQPEEVWGPKPGQFPLSKNYPGFKCLGVVDAANKIMLAERQDLNHLIGKRSSNVSKGSSGEFTIWLKTGSSFTAWAASTMTVTAECLGAAYTANKWAKLERIAGQWIAGPMEC